LETPATELPCMRGNTWKGKQAVKKILELVFRTLPLGLLVAHCATGADSGSQTHWLATCDQDADCGPGLACQCGRCMKECTNDACSGLARQAECVQPTSPARVSLCDDSKDTAICLPKCDAGCIIGESCIAGVCVRHSDSPEGGPGPTDGRPCPGEEVLVYETAGCGPSAKPVCDGPSFDACAMDACGCDGVTFHGGCGVFDRPFAHTGPCEDAAREAGSGGDGRVPWVGAPCEQCDLSTQTTRLAEPTSEDCGTVSGDAGINASTDCAHAALQAGRPFNVIVEQVGIDSYVFTAWVFAAGHLYSFSYDSNVCGGAHSCGTPPCGPRITRSTCVDPSPSSLPRIVFDCSSSEELQTICQPGL
jgi:hypothetical protein